jgi:hypothetical protein
MGSKLPYGNLQEQFIPSLKQNIWTPKSDSSVKQTRNCLSDPFLRLPQFQTWLTAPLRCTHRSSPDTKKTSLRAKGQLMLNLLTSTLPFSLYVAAVKPRVEHLLVPAKRAATDFHPLSLHIPRLSQNSQFNEREQYMNACFRLSALVAIRTPLHCICVALWIRAEGSWAASDRLERRQPDWITKLEKILRQQVIIIESNASYYG